MDSSNKAETLKEQVEALSREVVTTAVHNLQTVYLETAKKLRALPLNVHGSVLNHLQTEFQLRQEETKNAIDEHKYQAAVKQRAEQQAAQEKLAAEQLEIEEANKPRLVQPGAVAPN